VVKALIGYIRTDLNDKYLYKIKLNEFIKILKATEYEYTDLILQYLPKLNPTYAFGKGKVVEIKQKILETNSEVFIVYNLLNTIQKINLEDFLKVKVLDFYDLILEIFEKNAGDKVSKLQIQLARIQREIPYIKRRIALRVLKDRPGPRSLGEYAYHKIISQTISRRKRIINEIEKYKKIKEKQILKRKEMGYAIVTLCGFYSTGKTSLFNLITKLNKLVTGIPFTTLSSKYYLVNYNNTKFMLVDTIGFTFDLDPLLIESFDLTLKDITNANLNLLVFDGYDDELTFREKIKTNIQILSKLNVNNEKIIPVINKIDMIDKKELELKINIINEYFKNEPVYTSALKNYNIDYLLNYITKKL